ncbi:putative reactive intermediate deaminase TdcF [Vibrio crassostreae]|uniref:Putative reactive intermediate deaminase TdcF n=1 Tax=Vibrio crassostreae TaxID=246167 RepID=A0A822N5T8_9VIBR|nr:Rid family detoxifying hydrolase [Vibrio crassostreae]MDH5951652.1 Rid family detoxifying hydrolase [Vibrio crassostreae]TCN04918.1 2-iminobutanoate/2-iminopropanoate deaminase [Vibrio crassostreae]TCU06709.1 2-iminobutanoate/2-iminopropanoate deaminase [Vibrio crassostreae]CAK2042619.1 putative reactive intermediate deaminase TdcF [Vibrio crassostreae]CAK2973719.1 putative reactive intermediate deaminase TdcF [Vibrio crassostreae]
MRKIIDTQAAPKAIGPYSQGVISGGLIFTSGQLPLSPQTGFLIKKNIENQTRQCLENMRAILLHADADVSDVVKTTIYLTEIMRFSVVNEIYNDFFIKHGANYFPARTCIEVSKLPLNAMIEIEAVAVAP